MPREGIWINYQLELCGLTHTAIAERAGVSQSLVTAFLHCRRNSERVKGALASALGYSSWGSLHADARREGRMAA
jgi:hypothetical protein